MDIKGQVERASLLLLPGPFPSYIPPQSVHLVRSLSCLVFLPKENTLESLRKVYLACFEYSSMTEKAVVSFTKFLYFSAHSSILPSHFICSLLVLSAENMLCTSWEVIPVPKNEDNLQFKTTVTPHWIEKRLFKKAPFIQKGNIFRG